MASTNQTNNRVILVQACSWPVWEGSLLQFLALIFASLNKNKSFKIFGMVFDLHYPCCALSEEDWRFFFLLLPEPTCADPCSAFHTRTKFISSVRESSKDHFRVKLFFSPKMQVMTTTSIAIWIPPTYIPYIISNRWPRPILSSLHSAPCFLM